MWNEWSYPLNLKARSLATNGKGDYDTVDIHEHGPFVFKAIPENRHGRLAQRPHDLSIAILATL